MLTEVAALFNEISILKTILALAHVGLALADFPVLSEGINYLVPAEFSLTSNR